MFCQTELNFINHILEHIIVIQGPVWEALEQVLNYEQQRFEGTFVISWLDFFDIFIDNNLDNAAWLNLQRFILIHIFCYLVFV